MSRIKRYVNSLVAWHKMHLTVTDNIIPQGTNLISVNYRTWNAFMYLLTLITHSIPSDLYPVWWDVFKDHRMLSPITEYHYKYNTNKIPFFFLFFFPLYKQNIFILLSTNYKDIIYKVFWQAVIVHCLYSRDMRGCKLVCIISIYPGC